MTVPARIRGPVEFNILGVWSVKGPGVTYVDAVLSAIDAYQDLIVEGPCVVAGDFNANAIWNLVRKGRPDFAALNDRLNALGLVSAYHHFYKEEPGSETRATHYFRWKKSQRFHLDYCYIPLAWLPRLSSVTVPDFEWGAKLIDHRPVIIEVATKGV